MRRKGVVAQAGTENVLIHFESGGFLSLKRSAFPSLERDMHVVVDVNIAKAKKQPLVSPEEKERRRRSRWVVREFMRRRRAGERPSLEELLRRAHLQPVEDE